MNYDRDLWYKKWDRFLIAIDRRDIKTLKDLIQSSNHFIECEGFIYNLLKVNQTKFIYVLDMALEKFVSLHPSELDEHGMWVHSLSHFSADLWKMRMISWIIVLYDIAFRGADELKDYCCCNRLVRHFAYLALWSDDPHKFNIDVAFIQRCDMREQDEEAKEFIKERICKSPFHSESSYVKWQMEHPLILMGWSNEAQTHYLDIKKINQIVSKVHKNDLFWQNITILQKQLLCNEVIRLREKINSNTDIERIKARGYLLADIADMAIEKAFLIKQKRPSQKDY